MPKESKPTKETKAPAARRPTVRRRRTAAAPVTHDQIAERAYALFVAGTDGDAFEHWVRAERELTAA